MFRQLQRQTLGAHPRPQLAPPQYRLYLNCRNDSNHIAEAQFAHASAQLGVGTVARIVQHDTARYAGRAGSAELIERNLRLGLEFDLLGNTRLLAALGILGPFLRQIQPIGDRQAGMFIGNRQRHSDLAVGLLAQLPAILMFHPHRVLALFGEARVINDPHFDRAMALGSGHGARSRAAPSRATWSTPPGLTRVNWRRSAASFDAAPKLWLARWSQPSALRSCGHPSPEAPNSNRAAEPSDPHARWRSSAQTDSARIVPFIRTCVETHSSPPLM